MSQPKLTDNQTQLFNDALASHDRLLMFTRLFFNLRTGRDFKLSQPVGRESHYLTIARALHDVLSGKTKRLVINVPPRYGKSELLIHFVAWAMSIYPDSNFLYVSYSHTLAKKQTQTIRDIITLPHYKTMYGIELKDDSSAKDNFVVAQGGSVYAAGAGGTITGFGSGIKGVERFGGCIVIDDIHKPDEVTSDTMRESVIEWYYNTLQSRINSPNTPIIFIGQRLHEHDLAAVLLASGEYDQVILPAIDATGNALHPEMHDLKTLRKMQDESPYNFASQYQQNPQPAGGGLFKDHWFVKLEHEPKILTTFITIDTAETDKSYNDATVFSFWGLYRIEQFGVETELYGLHWLDCVELRVEPKDLEHEFIQFYRDCMRYYVKPKVVGVEKKSTGVTLSSSLKTVQGLQIIDIQRTKASGSKTDRYLEMQPYISAGHVSLPMSGKHTDMCIKHCSKITANNTHRFDDIADTLYDAVKLSLIDQVIIKRNVAQRDYGSLAKSLTSHSRKVDILRKVAYKD
jgi:predicted phage terminase large subunit-like protein